jgi:hypothetical protein
MTLRWNWGTAIATTYAAFVLSTMGFVAFAMSRPVALVSDDYYQQSLQEDGKREAVANARGLGTAVSVDVLPVSAVRVCVPGAAAAEGTLTFYRAADPGADRVVTLEHGRADCWNVPVTGYPRGRWTAQLRWTQGQRHFYFERELDIP